MNANLGKILILATIVSATFYLGCAKNAGKSPFRNDNIESAESIPLTIWHESLDEAMEESHQTGKPILADFTGSDWCKYCVKLENEVFDTDEFQQWARQNVVLLELDYPRRSMQDPVVKKQNAGLAKKYNIEAYPTVLLLNADGSVIGKLGYMNDANDWIAAAESQLTGGQ